jgi:hypothetical protein
MSSENDKLVPPHQRHNRAKQSFSKENPYKFENASGHLTSTDRHTFISEVATDNDGRTLYKGSTSARSQPQYVVSVQEALALYAITQLNAGLYGMGLPNALGAIANLPSNDNSNPIFTHPIFDRLLKENSVPIELSYNAVPVSTEPCSTTCRLTLKLEEERTEAARNSNNQLIDSASYPHDVLNLNYDQFVKATQYDLNYYPIYRSPDDNYTYKNWIFYLYNDSDSTYYLQFSVRTGVAYNYCEAYKLTVTQNILVGATPLSTTINTIYTQLSQITSNTTPKIQNTWEVSYDNTTLSKQTLTLNPQHSNNLSIKYSTTLGSFMHYWFDFAGTTADPDNYFTLIFNAELNRVYLHENWTRNGSVLDPVSLNVKRGNSPCEVYLNNNQDAFWSIAWKPEYSASVNPAYFSQSSQLIAASFYNRIKAQYLNSPNTAAYLDLLVPSSSLDGQPNRIEVGLFGLETTPRNLIYCLRNTARGNANLTIDEIECREASDGGANGFNVTQIFTASSCSSWFVDTDLATAGFSLDYVRAGGARSSTLNLVWLGGEAHDFNNGTTLDFYFIFGNGVNLYDCVASFNLSNYSGSFYLLGNSGDGRSNRQKSLGNDLFSIFQNSASLNTRNNTVNLIQTNVHKFLSNTEIASPLDSLAGEWRYTQNGKWLVKTISNGNYFVQLNKSQFADLRN